jgi:hypothetical protein
MLQCVGDLAAAQRYSGFVWLLPVIRPADSVVYCQIGIRNAPTSVKVVYEWTVLLAQICYQALMGGFEE